MELESKVCEKANLLSETMRGRKMREGKFLENFFENCPTEWEGEKIVSSFPMI